MKKLLTENIGLKILALISAFVLWMVVVNVDDPIISRTYSGINVEVVNGDAITAEGKTFEIIDGSDSISVTVSAKRSIIEQMSTEYIKATADMTDITFLDTVPIEVRAVRFADRIETISARNKNLKVTVEDLSRKQLVINVVANGNVDPNNVLGAVTPDVNVLTVSGPASQVSKITTARAEINVDGMQRDLSTTAPVILYDANGYVVDEPMIDSSVSEVHINAQVLETKEIDILTVVSGIAAEGYGATGGVDYDPATIKVAGRGSIYNNLMHVVIPEGVVSVNGAVENVVQTVDIAKYLPEGIKLADADFDGMVNVTAYVEKMQIIPVAVPIGNIVINNVPEGYSAHLVENTAKQIDIQGIPGVLAQVDASTIVGNIDASSLLPRIAEDEEYVEGMPHAGSNDGLVVFSCPPGVNSIGQVYMEVILIPLGEEAADLTE